MSSMKGVFLHNLPVKIVAFLAAFVLWIFVMGDQNPAMESGFSVPLIVLNRPSETYVTKDAESVKIKLRAPRSAFAEMSSEEIKAFIDLAGLEPGEHPLHVQTVVPQGLEVISVTPDTVGVNLDPIVQKRMPVRLHRTGNPPEGLTVASIEPDTRMVTLVGTQSAIALVDEVVGSVNVPSTVSSDADMDMDIEVSMYPVDKDGEVVENIRVVPREITAHVSFARGLSRKIVDVKPVVEGTPAEGYSLGTVRIEPARIEIAGTTQILDGISAISTEPIAAAGLTETVNHTAALVLPEGVTVTNKIVKVYIEIKKK